MQPGEADDRVDGSVVHRHRVEVAEHRADVVGRRDAVGERLGGLDAQQRHVGTDEVAEVAARFGEEALRFVNSRTGRGLRLRGLNARILTSGTVRPGDRVSKLAPADGPAA